MTKEQFETNTNWKMSYEELTYEEFQKYDRIHFDKKIAYNVKHIDECHALTAV